MGVLIVMVLIMGFSDNGCGDNGDGDYCGDDNDYGDGR